MNDMGKIAKLQKGNDDCISEELNPKPHIFKISIQT